MKFIDAKLEPWSDGEFNQIYLDEDCQYKWWESNAEYKYLYTCDKNLSNKTPRFCISDYYDGSIIGYCTCIKKFLNEDKYGFKKCDFYVDTLEFAHEGAILGNASNLITYYIRFARYLGAKFIRISTKEDFDRFYFLIAGFAEYYFEGDCYVIEIEDAIEYEEYIHLRSYDTDALSFNDLHFLSMFNYKIEQDKCLIKNGNDEFSIDRKTAKISIPSFITNDKGGDLIFCKEQYPLAFYMSRFFEEARKHTLTVNVDISDIPFKFAYLGNELLICFKDFTQDKNVFDILYKISKHVKFKNYRVMNAWYSEEFFNPGAVYSNRVLFNDLFNARLSLETDKYTLYAPSSLIEKNAQFNNNLEQSICFEINLGGKNAKFKQIKILFKSGKALVTLFDGEQKYYDINALKYIKILERAHFCNWQNNYIGDANSDWLSWDVTLWLENQTFNYKGINKTPKIWNYFIGELTEDIISK